MKRKLGWNHTPYKPVFFDIGDIYQIYHAIYYILIKYVYEKNNFHVCAGYDSGADCIHFYGKGKETQYC